jgi:L-aminopeptidase/D-esterase-like protein
MKEIDITQIQGFQFGSAEDLENGTGCTAILCKDGAVASVEVAGGGPATRDTDLLDPKNTVQAIHGVLLSGGSAFGLEAATGVMKYLAENGIGLTVGKAVVPIVVQADIFDLEVGNPVWPDVKMGYEAAKASETNNLKMGNHGAGTGASIAKLMGMEHACKSGLGTAAYQIGDLQVGAIAAVNACADVFEMDTKNVLGAVRTEEGFALTSDLMEESYSPKVGGNTTIVCVVTNGKLSKAEMKKLAQVSQDGLARTIHPVHMTSDGDTVFTMSSEKVDCMLDIAALMAVKAVGKAIENGVKSAEDAYGLPGYASNH